MPRLGLTLPLCTLVRGLSRPVTTSALRPEKLRVPSLLRGGAFAADESPHSDGGAEPPRLMLLSSGLTTPELERTFRRMLKEASAGVERPSITMVVTGQMAPSNESPDAEPPTPPSMAVATAASCRLSASSR